MATTDHSPHCTLPVDTYVRVTQSWREESSYVAKVIGYDMDRTKYEIGRRFPGWGEWLFLDGGSWAFPGEVEEISEEEATAVPSAAEAPDANEPDEYGEYPCSTCWTPGIDCLTRMNSNISQPRCCHDCGLSDTHHRTPR